MTILDYLEADAEKYPDKIAFADPMRKVAYRELNREVDMIARRISGTGFRNKPIAIYAEKSVTCICLMLGVMRSGNFFTVIDCDMPKERLETTLSVFEPVCICSEEKYKEKCANLLPDIEYLFYEDLMKRGTEDDGEEHLPLILPTETAVVLFTSGTTGVPKGVELSHGAIAASAEIRSLTFGYNKDVCFADQFPVYTLGHICVNIACTLNCSATDYIIPKHYFATPLKLLDFLKDTDVNILDWTAPALRIFSEYAAMTNFISRNVNKIVFGAELMPVTALNQLMDIFPDAEFINIMTASELSAIGAFYMVNREHSYEKKLPIGLPMKDTNIILIDENDSIVENGEIGELCISSAALAKGYYHNAEETERKFKYMKDESGKLQRFYKMGDLAYRNERGELEYVGRKDFQIKRHGYRIELEDVEATVNAIAGINWCGCIYDEANEKIVLFYMGDIDKKDLRTILHTKLSIYMLPDCCIPIASIPKNVMGKIDRFKLKRIYDSLESDTYA